VAPPQVIVTTSWDDGHQLDARLADELAGHGFAGTFYIAPESAEIPSAQRLHPRTLRALATRFEIGAHTLTHPRLTRLPRAAAEREIRLGQTAVQEITGTEVASFCYPYGAYRPEHVAMVRGAGFRVARTIRRFSTGPPADLLQLPTSTHAARYRADAWPVLRGGRAPAAGWRAWRDWDVLARELFQQARARGGIYHLWGHSWEIEAHRDWGRLRALLRYIAGHDGVTFLTNGELAGAPSAGPVTGAPAGHPAPGGPA
jgi:peptidoglycan-N-acetylglucosamine deacetylase